MVVVVVGAGVSVGTDGVDIGVEDGSGEGAGVGVIVTGVEVSVGIGVGIGLGGVDVAIGDTGKESGVEVASWALTAFTALKNIKLELKMNKLNNLIKLIF